MRKNVSYVGAKIIDYLDAQNILQKNVIVTTNLIHLKNYYFLLGPDLS